jgi:hypothetical protein
MKVDPIMLKRWRRAAGTVLAAAGCAGTALMAGGCGSSTVSAGRYPEV